MTLSLANLQSRFADALNYQAKGEECNIHSDHFAADQRMQIYRNNYIISLSEVLQATYPQVLALVGEECFMQIARHHVLNNPLQQGDVTHYGANFTNSIEQFEQVIQQAPYLLDVAALEWQLDTSNQSSNISSVAELNVLPLENLSQIDADQQPFVQLKLQNNLHVLASDYAVFSLWHGIKNNQLDNLDLSKAEQGVVYVDEAHQAHITPLNPLSFKLLEHCLAPHTLGTLPAELLPHLTDLVNHQLVIGFELATTENIE
ncbi:DNA-binding domain-containing protein [Vibrio tapetis]|uniref:Putative DNA-binding domain-containing protein n=1 Tax=Vibrio tapetis subsp. tapetis TaxID=1671868 RepID=A0A2N8ZH22_9VIBR|nr:DNA-binding domain-containing protein [Vibrio tapetis]SON51176.1 conserved protein of unknown function [Vibrio tapetis subsp. tapetis]